jgi:hypothetical protein
MTARPYRDGVLLVYYVVQWDLTKINCQNTKTPQYNMLWSRHSA